jgi:hypothetical protein
MLWESSFLGDINDIGPWIVALKGG